MTGLELVAAVAAAALLCLIWWLANGRARARREVMRLQAERNTWTPGAWRCRCGRVGFGPASRITQGVMLHGQRACEPDIEELGA